MGTWKRSQRSRRDTRRREPKWAEEGGASGIGRKSQSALDPKAKEQTITTYYRRNSIYGAHYRDDVYDAVERKNEKGGIEIVKAYGTFDNSNPKANTRDVTYKIQHGIVSYDDSRGIESYGIRWDKVTSVSGQTYNIRSMLKEKGFRWDGKTKSWVKK